MIFFVNYYYRKNITSELGCALLSNVSSRCLVIHLLADDSPWQLCGSLHCENHRAHDFDIHSLVSGIVADKLPNSCMNCYDRTECN